VASLRLYSPTTDTCKFKVILSYAFNKKTYKKLRITKRYYGNSTGYVGSYLETRTASSSYTKKYYTGTANTGLREGRTYTLYAYAQAQNGTWYLAGSDSITMVAAKEDLRIKSIIAQSNLICGEKVRFKIIVKNDGDKTSEDYVVKVYNEHNNKLDSGTESGIKAGKTANAYVYVTIDEPGSHRLKFKVNGGSNDTEYKTFTWTENMNNSSFILPVNASDNPGTKINSLFGYRYDTPTFHSGWDIGGGTGKTGILSIGIGTVVKVKETTDGTFGRYVVVDYLYQNQSFRSLYAHLASVGKNTKTGQIFKKGDVIQQGAVVGIMGGSGHTEDYYYHVHLHISTYTVDDGVKDDFATSESYRRSNAFDMFSGRMLKNETSIFSNGLYGLNGQLVTEEWFMQHDYKHDKTGYSSLKGASNTRNLNEGLYNDIQAPLIHFIFKFITIQHSIFAVILLNNIKSLF